MKTKSFSERVKAWRTKKGYTQERAAKELDVPLVTYRRWELGYNEPSARLVKLITLLLT